jgi:hypothetical protein
MKVKAPMLKLFGRDEQDLPALPIMSRHLIKMGEQSHLQGRSFGCTVVYQILWETRCYSQPAQGAPGAQFNFES